MVAANSARLRFGAVLGITVAAALVALHGVLGSFITTSIYLVEPDIVVSEDVYVAANSARVEGTVDGDLVISTGSLDVTGSVTGNVLVLSQGTVHISGDVGGSVRGLAREVIIDGTVAGDVAVAAVTTGISGTVDRDVLDFGGSLTLDGSVGRDVAGRMLSAVVDGRVGNDVDVAVGTLQLGPAADVVGDVLYRSGNAAQVSATAQVGSQFARLPTRGNFTVELVLTIATILSFLAFVVSGIIFLWLLRRTGPRAVAIVAERPIRATAVGVGAFVVLPLLVILAAITLVGAPVAVVLLLLLALALLFAPIPAVAALGRRILGDRRSIYLAFLLGAVIWRLGIWLIPLVGFALYLGALAAGLGGWLLAVWEQRTASGPEHPVPSDPAQVHAGWEPPLAPESPAPRDADGPDPGDVEH
jgi:cytoskeletal protein CcmA (bactofilin family)